MRLGLLLAVLALEAGAAKKVYIETQVRPRIDARGGRARNPSSDPLFQFAPQSGAGLRFVQPICDLLTADEKVGSWECYSGSGSTGVAWDGGTPTWTSAGSVNQQTGSLCPNGPNCASVTYQRYATNSGQYVAAYASGTDSVSFCALAAIDGSIVDQPLLTQSPNGGDISWHLEASGGAAARVYISNGTASNASSTGIGAAGYMLGTWHLFCGTWSASNGIIAYLDGVAGTPVAKAGRQSKTAPVMFGGYDGSGGASAMRIRGGFITHTELSAARIAAISRAVLADTPTGTKGEVLTLTRATGSSCALDATESEITKLPYGRPCITRGGLSVYRSGTNKVLRAEELNNAAWVNNVDAAPRDTTVTANAAVAPDGSLTADQLDLVATSGAQLSTRAQVNPCGGSVGVNSSYGVNIKGVSGSGTADVCFDTSCVACAFTSTAWALCKSENIADTNITQVTIGNNSAQNGGTSRPTQSIYVWGNRCFNGPYLSPYSATTSAAVTVNAETALFTTTAPSQPASLAATFTGSVVAPGAGGREFVMARTGASDYFAGRATTAAPTTLVCAANTATQTTTAIASGSRVGCYSSVAGIAACIDGICTATTGSPSVSANGTAVYVGYDPDNASWQMDGILGNVCLDNTTSRCR